MNQHEGLNILALLLFLFTPHCKSETFIDYIDSGQYSDSSSPEKSTVPDASVIDLPPPPKDANDSSFKWDGFMSDFKRKDALSDFNSTLHDAGKKDAPTPQDLSQVKDASWPKDKTPFPDTTWPKDAFIKQDAPKTQDIGSPVGPPCIASTGTAAYRFSYSNASTSAHVEAWGLKSNEWWEVVPVYAANSLVDNNQSLHLPYSSSYVRVRWSFSGIAAYSKATLCINARSYSTGSSAKFRVWSPIHGENSSDLVSVYPYDWHCLDVSSLMDLNDKPGLLGYRLYPDQYGSSSLAIHALELCLQGVIYQ